MVASCQWGAVICAVQSRRRGERGGRKQGPYPAGGLLPLCEVGRMTWSGEGGRAGCVLDASLQEEDGGGCDPRPFPYLLNLV